MVIRMFLAVLTVMGCHGLTFAFPLLIQPHRGVLCPKIGSMFKIPRYPVVALSTSSTLRGKRGGQGDDDADELPQLKRKLTKEFISIGAPALIQLAAEPLAALVDTVYLGRLGPEVLGKFSAIRLRLLSSVRLTCLLSFLSARVC